MSVGDRDCFGSLQPFALEVNGVKRCSTCGCDGVHGCGGPSRRWQEELVLEVVRLQSLVEEAREPRTFGASPLPPGNKVCPSTTGVDCLIVDCPDHWRLRPPWGSAITKKEKA